MDNQYLQELVLLDIDCFSNSATRFFGLDYLEIWHFISMLSVYLLPDIG